MRRLEYVGPNTLEWREAAVPRLGSDAGALVRPVAVATCDLDAWIVRGSSPFEPPFPIGHECVAEVVEIGGQVSGPQPGQLVTVPFQISCGDCPACRRGRTANCNSVGRMSTYGFGPAVETWGGFLSDLVLVPFADHMLVPVPDGVPPERAASVSDNVVDGWRCVAPALEREPGAPVLVVGGNAPGSIGLYATAIAVALGAERVLYVDSDQGRRGRAESLGAETVESAPRRLGPFPITVDANGTAEGIALALRSTAPDGVCTSAAIYFGDPPQLPLLEMYTKNITFITGRPHARTLIPAALDLIASGAFRPEEVTSRVVDWADAADALGEQGWTKLVFLHPDSVGPGSGPVR